MLQPLPFQWLRPINNAITLSSCCFGASLYKDFVGEGYYSKTYLLRSPLESMKKPDSSSLPPASLNTAFIITSSFSLVNWAL